MLIKIYGKDDCPFCNQAVELAQRVSASTETVPGEATIKWQYLKLGHSFTREQLFEKFPTARTFPQIMADDDVIGSFVDFQEWSKDYV
jgi:glutaredoxin 3